MRIAATTLALLCVLSTLAGCAALAQQGSLPTEEERCLNGGGLWVAVCAAPGDDTSVGAAARGQSA